MTTFKVYEIYNEIGNVYYVGCTKDMINRKSQHKLNGRYGTFHVVREFPEDKLNVALYYEAYLKYVHGLNDYIKPEKSNYNTKVKGGKTTGPILAKLNKEVSSKPVKVYTVSGEFVGEYYSQNEAARQLNVHHGNVNRCINGERKSTGGYIFKNA